MLSGKDLRWLRETTEGGFPGTAIVYAQTGATDGAGGRTLTYTASGTVACRYGSEKIRTSQSGDELGEPVMTPIFLPYDAVIYHKDRIRNPATGRDYEVIGITQESSETGTLRCESVRVR